MDIPSPKDPVPSRLSSEGPRLTVNKIAYLLKAFSRVSVNPSIKGLYTLPAQVLWCTAGCGRVWVVRTPDCEMDLMVIMQRPPTLDNVLKLGWGLVLYLPMVSSLKCDQITFLNAQ